MQTTYTNDPNAAMGASHWFNLPVFTWGSVKLKALCYQLEIPVGYQFMSSNHGFTYTVKSIVTGSANQSQQLGSISYLDNTLQGCQVEGIDIALSRTADNAAWWSWSGHVTATASCQFTNDATTSKITFGTEYNQKSGIFAYNSSLAKYDYVAVDNYTTRAPVWWGTRLLNNYYAGVLTAITGQKSNYNDTESDYINADISYYPGDTDDMMSFDLFNVSFSFSTTNGRIITQQDDQSSTDPALMNNKTWDLSSPITEGFFFAKVLRSLILVDLGNSEPPNLLLNANLLQDILNPSDDFNRNSGGILEGPLHNAPVWWLFTGISSPGTLVDANGSTSVAMNESYSAFIDKTGRLETKSSTIFAQYICSEPKAKSIPAMLFATLVADIALMQGVLAVFGFFALEAAKKRDSQAMYCPGCSAQGRQLEDLETANKESLVSDQSLCPDSVQSGASSGYRLLKDDPLDGQRIGE
jgi:hypothetical protein